MTEQDLIQLGFTREQETIESSGADTDWHYYTYDIGSLCLITPANTEVNSDEWYVELFDHSSIRIYSRTELEALLTILNNNQYQD